MKAILSGGPLGGQEVEFEAAPKDSPIYLCGIYAGVVEGKKNLARYELRSTVADDGDETLDAVFTGWVTP